MWQVIIGLTCTLRVVALSAFCPGPSAFGAPMSSRSALSASLLCPIGACHWALAPRTPLLPLSINCQSTKRHSVSRSFKREECTEAQSRTCLEINVNWCTQWKKLKVTLAWVFIITSQTSISLFFFWFPLINTLYLWTQLFLKNIYLFHNNAKLWARDGYREQWTK